MKRDGLARRRMLDSNRKGKKYDYMGDRMDGTGRGKGSCRVVFIFDDGRRGNILFYRVCNQRMAKGRLKWKTNANVAEQ
jgi:hypothetical protein